MATPPFILAKSLLEAHTYARENLGLAKGHYRVVTSPSSISGRRGADLHMLPGWERRHDRFAMRGALRYTRLKKIEVSEDFIKQVKRPVDVDFAAFSARMHEMMTSESKIQDAQWLRDLARDRRVLSLEHHAGQLTLGRDQFAAILAEEGFVPDEENPDNFVHPARMADALSGAYRDDVPSNGDQMISEGSPVEPPEPDGLEPPGVQEAIMDASDWFRGGPEFEAHLERERAELAASEEAHAHLPDPTEEDREQTGATEPSEDTAPPEEPKRRTRRRRCSECGLLVEPDEIEAHASEHLPEE